MMYKSYSELITIPTFIDRYRYLKIGGSVGRETFGQERYLNQLLYHDNFWKREVRPEIIVRDNCCDLALDGYDIHEGTKIFVHHINPITIDDILLKRPIVYDPENLVTTVLLTHNAIHYGNELLLTNAFAERTPNDTIPWRK